VRYALRTAWQAGGPVVRHGIALLIAFPLWCGFAPFAVAQSVKGEVSATTENGYARLAFRFAEEVGAQVRIANNILTITFPRPVDISIDRIVSGAAGYVAVARRDPDGKGLRMALSRKVTMNSMTAGERLFIDLLPDTWTGLAPGLPRDVIDELARRAREAERRARQQRALAQQSRSAPIRVKAIAQPTFTRYVFDLPNLISVSADNSRDRLTLIFDAMLRFDLADAIATLPAEITSISNEVDNETVVVRFNFKTRVDVRTFREDNSFVVDVEAERKPPRQEGTIRSDELSPMAVELTERPDGSPAKEAAPKSAPARKKGPAGSPEPRVALPNSQPQPAQPELSRPPAQQQPAQQPAMAPAPISAPPTQRNDPKPGPDQPTQPAPQAQAAPAQPPAPPQSEPAPQATPRPGSPAGAQQQSTAQPGATPAPAPQAVPPAPPPSHTAQDAKPPETPDVMVRAAVRRNGETLNIVFPFGAATPAAVFRRADTVWMVFDTNATIGISALNDEVGKGLRSAATARVGAVSLVRVKLERPQLISVAPDGNGWSVTFADEVVGPSRPLQITRNVATSARSSVSIAIDEARNLHRIDDPEIGDALYVVTALAPARGLLKSQDFVEFRILATAHGIALQPLADDLNAELSADKVVVTRPGGLSLSSSARAGGPTPQRQVLDLQSWGGDRAAEFRERSSQLMMAAAEASEAKRLAARCDLARFFLARDMFSEAKAVLDVAVADSPPTAEDSIPVVLRAIANIMIGRPEAAIKDLSNPFVGNQHDAALWRALASARLGKWADAREGFRSSEVAITTLPLEFQRTMLRDMVLAALEVGDVTGAANGLNEFELIGTPHEMEPSLFVLTGRLAEALGKVEDALRAYRAAYDSWDRRAAAQGRLREIRIQYGRGNETREAAIAGLETLTAIWRGDRTEVEALQLLTHLYTEDGRYRDAFNAARTAFRAHPNSDMTRNIQDEAVLTFDSLFLAGKGDALPAIDALALFYDFRELTPIGRRGDEMIRRLADRLVSVDLLYQATELLQHQVDHRLQGAARAQVAARLAVIYMMDRRPTKALATLRATRVAELNNDLRNQRLLLEARALSELGRHDVAYEIVANIPGRETVRLRSDILWAAKRWSASAEQLELMLGDRWKDFDPLGDVERADVLRAAVGYALGDDAIGLARFRERYLTKMGEGPDARAFQVITAPIGGTGTEFREIAHSLAAVDTLEAFLRDLRARYPETGAMPAGQRPPAPPTPPAAATSQPAAG
jgi:tetratricopeptide (TPR) repeat protein